MKFQVLSATLAACTAVSASASTPGVGQPECECIASCHVSGYSDIQPFHNDAPVDTVIPGKNLTIYSQLPFHISGRTLTKDEGGHLHWVTVIHGAHIPDVLVSEVECKKEGLIKSYQENTGLLGKDGQVTAKVYCVKNTDPKFYNHYHFNVEVSKTNSGLKGFAGNEGKASGLCATPAPQGSTKGPQCTCTSTCGSSKVGDGVYSFTGYFGKSSANQGIKAYASNSFTLTYGMHLKLIQKITLNGNVYTYDDSCKPLPGQVGTVHDETFGNDKVHIYCAKSSGILGRRHLGFDITQTSIGSDETFDQVFKTSGVSGACTA